MISSPKPTQCENRGRWMNNHHHRGGEGITNDSPESLVISVQLLSLSSEFSGVLRVSKPGESLNGTNSDPGGCVWGGVSEQFSVGLKVAMFNSPICISLLPILALPPRPDSICKKPQDGGAIWAAKAGLWAFLSRLVQIYIGRWHSFPPSDVCVCIPVACSRSITTNRKEWSTYVRTRMVGSKAAWKG